MDFHVPLLTLLFMSLPKCLGHLPAGIPFLNILSFVIKLLPFCNANLYLSNPPFEINLQRNQIIPPLLHLPENTGNLFPMEKEFAPSPLFMVVYITSFIWTDIAEETHLPPLYPCMTISQAHPTITH